LSDLQVTPGMGAAAAAPGGVSGLSGAGPSGAGFSGAGFPGVADRTELPGGLRVLSETVPGARSVSVGIWIGVGARDERPEQAGAAHYLEHLLFKGTEQRTAAAIAEEVDAVGGELNAFTAKEHTCYYAHVLDSDLALAVDVLADVVTAATLRHADVEVERSVVLEEIAIRDDDPEELLGELFDEAVFGTHPLARPVLGTEKSVRGLTRYALHGFWRGEYTTPRMVVAAAGNVEHARLVELVGAALAPAAARAGATSPVPPRRPDPAALAGGPRLVLRPDDTEQVHLMLGAPGLSRHDPRRSALTVLSTALGGGPSSRLFQQVREQRGLAYSVYSALSTYADAGTFAVYAGCAPERLAEAAEVVRGILDDVARNGLTPAEVARAQGNLRGGLILGLEDTSSRMNRLGRSEIDHGRQRTIGESLDRIAAVTEQQVRELARELLSAPLVAAVVGPYDSAADLPPALRSIAS
jgi:predicted Zn-dependent peptidase